MYFIRCPHCDDRTGIPEEWFDSPLECCRCHKYFLAAENEEDNTPAQFVDHMRAKVKSLADGLMCAVIVGSLPTFPALALSVFMMFIGLGFGKGGDQPERLREGLLFFTLCLVQLSLSGLVIYGSRCLAKLKHYRLCQLVSVLVMLPFANMCFPLGWIFGPFTLYWLATSQVRQAFRMNRGEWEAEAV